MSPYYFCVDPTNYVGLGGMFIFLKGVNKHTSYGSCVILCTNLQASIKVNIFTWSLRLKNIFYTNNYKVEVKIQSYVINMIKYTRHVFGYGSFLQTQISRYFLCMFRLEESVSFNNSMSTYYSCVDPTN